MVTCQFSGENKGICFELPRLQSYKPLQISDTLELSKDFIQRLKIKQLLPPIKDISVIAQHHEEEISDQ